MAILSWPFAGVLPVSGSALTFVVQRESVSLSVHTCCIRAVGSFGTPWTEQSAPACCTAIHIKPQASCPAVPQHSSTLNATTTWHSPQVRSTYTCSTGCCSRRSCGSDAALECKMFWSTKITAMAKIPKNTKFFPRPIPHSTACSVRRAYALPGRQHCCCRTQQPTQHCEAVDKTLGCPVNVANLSRTSYWVPVYPSIHPAEQVNSRPPTHQRQPTCERSDSHERGS